MKTTDVTLEQHTPEITSKVVFILDKPLEEVLRILTKAEPTYSFNYYQPVYTQTVADVPDFSGIGGEYNIEGGNLL